MYVDVTGIPDVVTIQRAREWIQLTEADGLYTFEDVVLQLQPDGKGRCTVRLTAEHPVSRVVLRWRQSVGAVHILNDHWERGYGDLMWSSIMPDRELPWYFAYSDGKTTHGAGVKTTPNAICHWQVDANRITLVLDVRSGGVGVQLKGRTLQAATIVSREGRPEESRYAAVRALCQMMCDSPRMPKTPVYGGNNWYYAYGVSSHEEILRDSRLISELAGDADNRPFMVIDAGWHTDLNDACQQPLIPWDGTEKFPDMQRLASEMKQTGVRPGLWFRPLLTGAQTPKHYLLNAGREIGKNADGLILDPSLPEVLDLIQGYMRRFAEWGYELVKHDFSTYDLIGRWGFTHPGITENGWQFADPTKTTAEIVLDLYRALRQGAGDETLIIGCNTFSHLSAGIFEIQRTGDDTSGEQWERTRKMGVNTLAFRMPQHGTFYAADADCVGLTPQVPWPLNRQWLSLLAQSGTVVFVSADPKMMGEEQKKAVSEAFALCSRERPPALPLDWAHNATPALWDCGGEITRFDWVDDRKLENCSGWTYTEV